MRKSLTNVISKRTSYLGDMVRGCGILDRIFTSDSVVKERIEYYTSRAKTDRKHVADTARILRRSSFGACGNEIKISTHGDALDADYSEAMAQMYEQLRTARRGARTKFGKLLASVFLR